MMILYHKLMGQIFWIIPYIVSKQQTSFTKRPTSIVYISYANAFRYYLKIRWPYPWMLLWWSALLIRSLPWWRLTITGTTCLQFQVTAYISRMAVLDNSGPIFFEFKSGWRVTCCSVIYVHFIYNIKTSYSKCF